MEKEAVRTSGGGKFTNPPENNRQEENRVVELQGKTDSTQCSGMFYISLIVNTSWSLSPPQLRQNTFTATSPDEQHRFVLAPCQMLIECKEERSQLSLEVDERERFTLTVIRDSVQPNNSFCVWNSRFAVSVKCEMCPPRRAQRASQDTSTRLQAFNVNRVTCNRPAPRLHRLFIQFPRPAAAAQPTAGSFHDFTHLHTRYWLFIVVWSIKCQKKV